ncbi:hypothetical protein RCL1_006125 [Eukaryota sp. TZLM3-RCL]
MSYESSSEFSSSFDSSDDGSQLCDVFTDIDASKTWTDDLLIHQTNIVLELIEIRNPGRYDPGCFHVIVDSFHHYRSERLLRDESLVYTDIGLTRAQRAAIEKSYECARKFWG